eukprot:3140445-Amphidinium_carterae.1
MAVSTNDWGALVTRLYVASAAQAGGYGGTCIRVVETENGQHAIGKRPKLPTHNNFKATAAQGHLHLILRSGVPAQVFMHSIG